MEKDQSNFRTLGLISAGVCFLGMYLDIKQNMEIGKVLVALGFLITSMTYVLGRKQNNKNSKANK